MEYGINKILTCKICQSNTKFVFDSILLKKYTVKYFYCDKCGFLQTEEPYWLEEAYKSPINLSDTGLVQRNIYLSEKVATLLFFFWGKNGKYLDFAGGYGLFTRLMRDIGFNFYWTDPHAQNLFAKGFEYNNENKIDVITTFEVFEHLVNPMEEIEKIIEISPNIVFTTGLLPNNLPLPQDWWYYGLEHGQHISFYSSKTLKYIAEKNNLNFLTNGIIHLITKKNINQKFYTLLLKFSKLGLYKIIKKIMISRTLQDMAAMKILCEKN